MKVFRWDWTGQQPGLFEVTSSSGLSINQGRLLMSTTTSGSSHIGSYSERIASLIFIAIIAPRVFAGLVRAGFASSITALKRDPCIKIGRGKYYAQAFPKSLIASPSFHGGRGALPSAGGHPADLTFLAGGGH